MRMIRAMRQRRRLGQHLPRRRRAGAVRRHEGRGFGRERGEQGILEFTQTKNVMIDFSGDKRDPFSMKISERSSRSHMTYLVADDLPTLPAGERFRKLLERPGILQIPGAYNGLAALQAKAARFEALYLSGAAMSASMGLPDLGILTIDDVCFFIRQVPARRGLPVLVDGDTGFGEALNVMHMVRAFEERAPRAVQIEDQILPKKCGHLNDKKLIAPRGHGREDRRRRARRAGISTSSPARMRCESEGLDGAIARARLYVEAGADAIFPEALNDRRSIRQDSPGQVKVPLLANMTEFGRTPFMTAQSSRRSATRW